MIQEANGVEFLRVVQFGKKGLTEQKWRYFGKGISTFYDNYSNQSLEFHVTVILQIDPDWTLDWTGLSYYE
uniref:Uncharacterized protein n=1 Tax=Caenorhabditis japonica TaxID=281687 RepID=A0A8R1EH21_CAEJA